MAEEWEENLLVFVYDSTGSPIGMMYRMDGFSEGLWENYWFEKNMWGDITAIYDDAGNLIIEYKYDPWGNCTEEQLMNSYGAQYNPFRYRGYYYDADLGLYYLNSRYYDSNTCRFISPDAYEVISATPMALTDKNLYAYCDNNPITRVDNGGEFWETLFDVVSLGVSVVDVCMNPDDPWAWAGLAGDAVDLIPFVSGVGETLKVANTGRKVADAVAETVDTVYDVTKATQNVTELSNDLRRNQKALHELANEIDRNARNGIFISQSEAKIFDEWCREYGVSQHHGALVGSGKHWKTGWDYTHWFGKHFPFK